MKNKLTKISYLNILKKLCEDDYTQSELNHFIENLFILASGTLNHQKDKLFKVYDILGLTIDDIAIDSISVLFYPDKDGLFHRLIKEYKSWRPKIDSEESAKYFITKLVYLRVEQHLLKIYRDLDPLYSKLLDSVNYVIKKNGYVKIDYMTDKLITESQWKNKELTIISDEEIQKFDLKLSIHKKNILNEIFKGCEELKIQYPAIKLSSLILKLKQMTIDQYESEFTNVSVQPSYEINAAIEGAISFIKSRIKNIYKYHNKLNETECAALYNAVKDVAMDFKGGGKLTGLYHYLSRHLDDLDTETYQRKYQNNFEYMVLLLKEKLIADIIIKK